jgi:hypothetical protein
MTPLFEARNFVREFFDVEALTAFKIVTFDTKRLPITPFIYQHYGELDKTETIIDLNGLNDLSFVEGEVNLLGL